MASSNLQLANEISTLCKDFDSGSNDARRLELLSKIEALHRKIQPTSHTLYQDWADMARIKCVSALLQHGVIQAIPNEGFISAKRLAEITALEEPIVIRLMRHLTSQGLIELGPEKQPNYSHTDLSRAWLDKGGPDFTMLMIKDVCRPDLGNYFKTHKRTDLESPSHNPGIWQDGIEGGDWFDLISRDPARVAIFDGAMQFSAAFFSVFGLYPFAQLVDDQFPSEKPLIVDIGGGRGQALLEIKQTLPKLKGRLILQDRPNVLAGVTQTELGDIEKMDHDFFTPQPVKGAKIYYIRRVTHDWDDASVLTLLTQTASGMSSESRLLINDLILPERAVPGSDLTPLWMDFAVMMVGGKERTESEIIELLDQAGFEHVKTWRMEVSMYVVIEAKLKGA